jgi:hypothetical protein
VQSFLTDPFFCSWPLSCSAHSETSHEKGTAK